MKWILILIVYGTSTGGPSITTVPTPYTESGCHAAAEAFEQAKPARYPGWIKRTAFCIPGPDGTP